MPTRHELDTVSPNNPVFIPRGGHVITVNSKALELAGITKETPNPDGGVIVREGTPSQLKAELRERQGLATEPSLDDVFLDATGRTRSRAAGDVQEVSV